MPVTDFDAVGNAFFDSVAGLGECIDITALEQDLANGQLINYGGGISL